MSGPPESVLHALFANAERGADAGMLTLAPSSTEHIGLRYDRLARDAVSAAMVLRARGVHRGDRVLLALRTSPEFVVAFLGALLAGAVPVAVATPARMGTSGAFEALHPGLLAYLRPALAITTPRLAAELRAAGGPVTAVLDGEEFLRAAKDCPDLPVPSLPHPDELAFLQLTSGSTGTPKAVMITHGNVAANCRQLGRASGWGLGDVQVAWLPLHHDMGLIGTLLAPIYHGTDALLLAPETFLRTPAEWFAAISRANGTLAATPNFGLSYATARIRDEQLDGVDLTSLRFVFCGAEPIDPATVSAFVERFAPWGLRRDVLVPCYGLAEATLAVTVGRTAFPLRFHSVPDAAPAGDGRSPESDGSRQHVAACGAPLEGTELRIVDATGAVLAPGALGRIQFRGPSRTAGYYGLPLETAAVCDDHGWWDTGDLGYLLGGELYVAGRAKDVIIIRGVNYFPTDFERATETVAGIRLGRVAAVGIFDGESGTDALHIIAETDRDPAEHPELTSAVVAAVTGRCGVAPAAVHLLPRGTIPKTTSGKLRRREVRNQLLHRAGALITSEKVPS